MNLIETLKNYSDFASVVPFNWQESNYIWLDFTAKNQELANVDLENTAQFSDYVFSKLRQASVKIGIGGYFENRAIYRRSKHFQSEEEPRTLHLGVDIWAEVGTPIFSPLDGQVHSFQNNDNFGDYGPTIILEHSLNGETFFTLYGHLSVASLNGLFEGKHFKKGEKIAEFGNFPENGDWPPHLHFQLMTTMLGLKGDFPGVCKLSDRDKFQKICLDPNWILFPMSE